MKKWIGMLTLKALMACTIAVTVTLPGSALAHDAKPKHGGMVREVGELQF